jgi:plastocyanin
MGVFSKARRFLVLPALSSGLLACSSGTSGGGNNSSAGGNSGIDAAGTGPYTITIQSFAYDPLNIDVPAGETLWVVNKDVEAHSVTSESKLGDYALGAVNGVQFDTGSIGTNTGLPITLPVSATPSTVVPYYCSLHKDTMPQGTVTVL